MKKPGFKFQKVKLWNGLDVPIYFLDPGGKNFRPIIFIKKDDRMIQLGHGWERSRHEGEPLDVAAGRQIFMHWKDVRCNFCGNKDSAIMMRQVEPGIVACYMCAIGINQKLEPIKNLEKYFWQRP